MMIEKSPRLLIVEDDRRTREALNRLFTDTGWSVVSVTTAADGLSQLDPPPRCVLMDLSLPDAMGELILKSIRSSGQPIRVVVCTGCADPARLAHVQSLRPDALLMKPVDPDELLSVCLTDS